MICSLSGESLVSLLNELFIDKYEKFLFYSENDKDRLHKNYLKLYDRFQNLVFTANTENNISGKVIGYCRTSMYNTMKTDKKFERNNIEINSIAENVLRDIDEDHHREKKHDQEMMVASYKLFEYLKKNYSIEENYVFQVYYLYDGNRKITYKKLSKITGFSLTKVCLIVQKMKKDLKQNLIGYINT